MKVEFSLEEFAMVAQKLKGYILEHTGLGGSTYIAPIKWKCGLDAFRYFGMI